MIRRAVYADVPELRRLFTMLVAELEAVRPVKYPWHVPDDLDAFTLLTARRLATDPLLLCYIATDDATGEGVAFLGGEVAQRALGQPRIFGAAHWLYVMPQARSQGLARGLVRLACEDLVALGITHVELAAMRGDLQWATRGWIPYLIHHVLPIEAVMAGAAPRPVIPEPVPGPAPVAAASPEPVAPEPPAPAPAPEPLPQPVAVPPTPRRRHRRRTPPAAAEWNGA